jgi:Zn-dependent peptidase ImmA (M78 family)
MLTNCAEKIPRTFQVPDSVLPHILEFELQAALHGKPIHITDLIVKLKPELSNDAAVGMCYYGTSKEPPEIHFLQWYWNLANDAHRENLVFHELGHCVLNRDHVNRINLDGVPESIMNYSLMEPYQYEMNRAILLQELFNDVNLH